MITAVIQTLISSHKVVVLLCCRYSVQLDVFTDISYIPLSEAEVDYFSPALSRSIIKNQNEHGESFLNIPQEMHSCMIFVLITKRRLKQAYPLICSSHWSCATVQHRKNSAKESALKWSEDQVVPVDWKGLELLNKDFVTLIQFAKWLMWLKRFFGPKFSYGWWLHSHGRGMTSHDCLEKENMLSR